VPVNDSDRDARDVEAFPHFQDESFEIIVERIVDKLLIFLRQRFLVMGKGKAQVGEKQ
jgi:hypothetical protein